MKIQRSFVCGQRVHTYCYMAIVQGTYAYVYVYERTCVSTVVLTYVQTYASCTQLRLRVRTYILRCTYMCKYGYAGMRTCVYNYIIYYYTCVSTGVRMYNSVYKYVRAYVRA